MTQLFGVWLCSFVLHLPMSAASSDNLRIALYGGDGAILGDPDFPYQQTLEKAAGSLGKFSIDIYNTSADLQKNLTTDLYDVIFVPGGSGSKQAFGLGEQGMAVIKAFVSNGGGYIGTCGGAFLGLSHLKFYGDGPDGEGFSALSLGTGEVEIEFTDQGFQDFSLDRQLLAGNVTIEYVGGPVVATKNFPSNVKILAWYRTNVPAWLFPTGKDTPSMTYAEYGAGRVVLNSPHPEHVKSAAGIGPEIYGRELAWASRRVSTPNVISVHV